MRIKRLMAILCCFMMVAALLPTGFVFPTAMAAGDLLNGGTYTADFNSGISGWGALYGSADNGIISQNTDYSHEGSGSLLWVKGTSTSNRGIQANDDIILGAGESVWISYWVFWSDGDPGSTATRGILTQIGMSGYPQVEDTIPANKWTFVIQKLTSASGGSGQLQIQPKSSNLDYPFLIDDVCVFKEDSLGFDATKLLRMNEPAGSIGTLSQSFESDSYYWMAGGNGTVSVGLDSAIYHRGAKSLKYNGTGRTSYGGPMRTDINIVEGNRYLLSFWLYTETAGLNSQIQTLLPGSAGQYGAITASTWKNHYQLFTASSSSSTAAIMPQVTDNVDMYIDDFYLYDITSVPVTLADPDSIDISDSTLSLTSGGSSTLTATGVSTKTVFNKKVAWSSNDTGVATVDSSGNVSAIGPGSATITATIGGKTNTCAVTVSGAATPITSMTVPATLEIEVGDADVAPTVTILPIEAPSSYTLSSDNTAAVTIVSNKIHAVDAGTANVTVTAAGKNGAGQAVTDTIAVTVRAAGYSVNETLNFESDAEGWVSRGQTNNTVEVSPEQSYKGDYSLKVTTGSTSWHAAKIPLSDLGITKAGTYNWSFYLYSEDGRAVQTTGADSDFAGANGAWTGDRYPAAKPAEVWNNYSGTLTVTAADLTRAFQIQFQTSVAGVYYLDCFQIWGQGNTPTDLSTLADPGGYTPPTQTVPVDPDAPVAKPSNVPNGIKRIYDMSTDQISQISRGYTDSYLQNNSATLSAVDYSGKLSINVAGSGLDIKQAGVKLRGGAEYSFVIYGHYAVPVDDTTVMKLATSGSGTSVVIASAQVESDGSFVIRNDNASLTWSELDGTTYYRITSSKGSVPFIIDGILITQITNAPPLPDPGDGVIYNMQSDLASVAVGALTGTSFVAGTGGGSPRVAANGTGKSLTLVGTRTADWNGIDLYTIRMPLNVGKDYIIKVTGRVAAGVKVKMAMSGSPYSTYASQVSSGTFEVEAKFHYGSVPEVIRIQTESAPTVDLYIDGITVTQSTPATVESTPVVPPPAGLEVKTTVSEDGTSTAQVTAAEIKTLITKAMTPKKVGEPDNNSIILRTEAAADAKSVQFVLPTSSISEIANDTKLSVSVDAGLAALTFDTKALKSIVESDETGADIKISVTHADKSILSAEDAKKVGDRPVYDFSVMNGDTKVSNFNGGKVEVSIPYTLAPGEVASALVIYYIDDEGNVKQLVGKYKRGTGTVVFTTTHFSVYALGYNHVEFSDVPQGSRYYDAVTFLAARGITDGVGGGKFGLTENLTRSMFIVMLLRAFEIAPDANPSDNFSDAGNTWYTGYLSAAKRLAITNGVGNNMFAPDEKLTEWQLQTFMSRTLSAMGAMEYEVSETASETKLVTRGEMAEFLYLAISSGYLETSGVISNAPAVLVTVYDMAADEEITGKSDGAALGEYTKVFQNCGGSNISVKEHDGSMSIISAGRTQDYNGIDIKQDYLKLKAGFKCSFVIKGHVVGTAPDGAKIQITATNSSGNGTPFATAELTSDGEFVLSNEDVTFDTLAGITFYRVNTSGAANVTFCIDSIVISMEE